MAIVGRITIESVCRAKVKVRVNTTNENAVFDALCELTTQHNLASVPLGHHVYDQRSNRWLGRSSKPQPFVRLSVSIEKEDYEHFGLQLSFSPDNFLIDAMVDTGCQSCLVGLELIEKTGMSRRDLIPVTMRMRSADNRNISILGAVIIKLCGMDQSGSERMTRQIIYVTDSTDKFFLSREACIDVGIIPIHFPVIGEVPIPADHQLLSTDYASSSRDMALLDCDCPRQTRLPPLPTTLPSTYDGGTTYASDD